MVALIRLSCEAENYIDEVTINNVINPKCLDYYDDDSNRCELNIFNDGICMYRHCEDHLLELVLRKDSYIKITTKEGELKLSAKVVDFNFNDDILVVRYIVENVERKIEIIYRG